MLKGICKRLARLFVLILIFTVSIISIASAQILDILAQKENLHPKLESVLADLYKENQKGEVHSQNFVKQRDLVIEDDNKMTVFIVFKNRESIDIATLRTLGLEVIKSADNVVKVRMPINNLAVVAESVKGISFIQLPNQPHLDVVSEGVGITNASLYHSAGSLGTDVKVAIVDLGFAGLASAISVGELPDTVMKIDCTGSNCVTSDFLNETEPHGTAVAEIIHDMAPGAQLYLLKVADELDLVDAKNYCIANGIKIINHSVGWFNTNFYDGMCYNSNPVCTAENAYENGILWVNSAGNYAQKHYEAVFRDTDSDGFHNITEDNELIRLYAKAGEPIRVFLTWNAWPTTNQDYDLFLVDDSFNLLSASRASQNGTQPPTEGIIYIAPYTGTYFIAIGKYSASSNHQFEIYSSHPLSPSVASSSLASPADAKHVLTVGAINYSNWATGPQEPFSSQGPSNNWLSKPDIVGPDGVSTYTYGTNEFSGTSAAAPHVAGAAALLLSSNPSYSVAQIWSSLMDSAIDMGENGVDNVYGFGRLNLQTQFVGTIGTSFTITGAGFGTTKPKVYVDYEKKPGLYAKVYAKVTAWNDSSITSIWTNKLPPGAYNLFVQPNIEGVGPIRIGLFSIMNPIIDEVTPKSGLSKDIITIQGRFFTTKKPNIYLENVITYKRKSCKVVSYTMNPENGLSSAQFMVPSSLDSGKYYLDLKNIIGDAWDKFVYAPRDTTPPTVPILTAVSASPSRIDLTWTAATDDIGVAGYKIYKLSGSFLGSVAGTWTYFDNLNPNTQYCYTITAYDEAGNESGYSNPACAKTMGAF
jgi:hypothetical protein